MPKAIEGGRSSEETAVDQHMEGPAWITLVNHPTCSRPGMYIPLQLNPMLRLQCVINIHNSHVTIVRYLCSRYATGTLTHGSPFLQFVSNTDDFDRRLSQYVTSDYVQLKWVSLTGGNMSTLMFFQIPAAPRL